MLMQVFLGFIQTTPTFVLKNFVILFFLLMQDTLSQLARNLDYIPRMIPFILVLTPTFIISKSIQSSFLWKLLRRKLWISAKDAN